MISAISRNTLAAVIEIVDDQGNVVVPARIDIREGINSSKLSDLKQTNAKQGDTWGLLGLNLLGDARHWWVIAELSGVLDPYEELIPGLQLQYPSPQTLFGQILTGNVILNSGP